MGLRAWGLGFGFRTVEGLGFIRVLINPIRVNVSYPRFPTYLRTLEEDFGSWQKIALGSLYTSISKGNVCSLFAESTLESYRSLGYSR